MDISSKQKTNEEVEKPDQETKFRGYSEELGRMRRYWNQPWKP